MKIKMVNNNIFITDQIGEVHQLNTKTKTLNSKYIDRITYIPKKDELEVKFSKGSTYRYYSNDKVEFSKLLDSFLSSEQVDKDFHPLIRNNSSVEYRQI